MRLLLIDNVDLGHHPVYFRAVLEELLSLGVEVTYAFPQQFKVNAQHINFKASKIDKIATRIEKFCGLPVATWLNWRKARKLQQSAGADFVFFLYLDRYLHSGLAYRFPVPWVGLYFHPHSLRRPSQSVGPWRQLKETNAKFIYVLDEGVVEKLRSITGKPIFKFPDFSEGVVAACSCGERVRAQAAGRPIIGVLGALSQSKNILRALYLAEQNPQWHFVFAGPFFQQTFSREELAEITKRFSLPNVSVHLESMADENLNFLHSLSTVLYAPYLNFFHSSNKLTKACLFRTPIVVSKGYYMAEVVEHYGLGLSVDPFDLDELHGAIRRLLDSPLAEPDFDGYLAKNSRDALQSAVLMLKTKLGQDIP